MTKSLNYAKSLDISITYKNNIASQAKKIRGGQKPKSVNPETTKTDFISTPPALQVEVSFQYTVYYIPYQ